MCADEKLCADETDLLRYDNKWWSYHRWGKLLDEYQLVAFGGCISGFVSRLVYIKYIYLFIHDDLPTAGHGGLSCAVAKLCTCVERCDV